MARKSFLLRIDASVLEAVQRWANDDLRSLNAQIEYVLRDALRRVGRPPRQAAGEGAPPGDSEGPASERQPQAVAGQSPAAATAPPPASDSSDLEGD